MESLGFLLYYLIGALQLIAFIYVLLSWFMSPLDPVLQFLGRLIEPLIAPIRQMMPQTGAIDFSIIVFFFLLEILKRFLLQVINL